jgi:Fic family protein
VGRIWNIQKFLKLEKGVDFNSGMEVGVSQKEAEESLRERTEERKGKILEIMKDLERAEAVARKCNPEKAKKGIDREDVERWLGVSKNTALKYLNELEDDGEIEQVGETGRGVYYRFRK